MGAKICADNLKFGAIGARRFARAQTGACVKLAGSRTLSVCLAHAGAPTRTRTHTPTLLRWPARRARRSHLLLFFWRNSVTPTLNERQLVSISVGVDKIQ